MFIVIRGQCTADREEISSLKQQIFDRWKRANEGGDIKLWRKNVVNSHFWQCLLERLVLQEQLAYGTMNQWYMKMSFKKIMTELFTSAYENESMFRTLGASGISINKELVKNVRRLLASRFEGTSIADSFTVSNSSSLFIWSETDHICNKHLEVCHLPIKKCAQEIEHVFTTFSSQASVAETCRGNLIAPDGWNNWYSWSHVVVPSFLPLEPPWLDSKILSCWGKRISYRRSDKILTQLAWNIKALLLPLLWKLSVEETVRHISTLGFSFSSFWLQYVLKKQQDSTVKCLPQSCLVIHEQA